MAVHRDLPESECHEAKGIISSTTADAGKVLTPSSTTNGTSELRNLTRTEIGFEPAYSDMTLTENSTTVSVTAAVDSTLNTNSDYVEVTIPMSFNTVKNFGNGTAHLIVQKDGIYQIDFWANAKSSVNSTTLGLKFVVNDTTFVSRHPKLRLPNNGIYDNFSANGLHSFLANDTVKIYIASDTTADITIEHMSFMMTLVEET